MGKRFDAWVAEFESWGMTHDEAVDHAQTYWRSNTALAIDNAADALADVFRPLLDLVKRILPNRSEPRH